jgi:hypothetical protein
MPVPASPQGTPNPFRAILPENKCRERRLSGSIFVAVGVSYLLRGLFYGPNTVDGISFPGVSLCRRVLAYLVVLFLALAGGVANGPGHLLLSATQGRYFLGAATAPLCLLMGIRLLARLFGETRVRQEPA